MAEDKDLFGAPSAPGPRETRGRKRFRPVREQLDAVQTLAGYGVPQDDIARILNVNPKTLRKSCRDELDRGNALANAKVAQNLFSIATGTGREAVTAGMFWLRCRAGWSEFSPPQAPSRDRDVPLGKKDAAALAAETAEEGTGWSGLVH